MYVPVILLAVLVIVCKLVLDLFLSTGFGLSMRAAGANPRMAQANGVRVDVMTLVGLGIANALSALSGALFAQMLGAADVSMGIGVIVIALAAVIGGMAVLPSRTIFAATLACVIGSVVYRFAIAAALSTGHIGLTASDVNLVTAVLVALALYAPGRRPGLFKRSDPAQK
jgi:putative ABC transport system permease protein